jgi:hypothetical protein
MRCAHICPCAVPVILCPAHEGTICLASPEAAMSGGVPPCGGERAPCKRYSAKRAQHVFEETRSVEARLAMPWL